LDAASPTSLTTGRALYALYCGSGGNHYITGISPTLEAPPYNGYFVYNVAWPPPWPSCPMTAAAAAAGSPIITFTANWTEP